MRIQKIANINFQNNTKSNIARKILYSVAATTALLTATPKTNAQEYTGPDGQTYVHYSNYVYWKNKVDQLYEEQIAAGDQMHAAQDEYGEAYREFLKLKSDYKKELKYNKDFENLLRDETEYNSERLYNAQTDYSREVNRYNNYIKQHKASSWIGFGVGSLLGLLGFAAFNRKSKK